MRLILEHNRIPKSMPFTCVWIGVEQLPTGAAVGRLVEPREIAGAGGHGYCGIGIPSPDAAEVELLGSGWHGAGLPHVAAVFGAEDGAVCSAGPGDSVADGVDAAEAGFGGGVLEFPWDRRWRDLLS